MLTLAILFIQSALAQTICATKYSELVASPRMVEIQYLFSADRRIAMVNQTQGSYVVIEAFDDTLTISFFTSGLFELYPIRKDGPLQFCDDGTSLRMIGLGRADVVRVVKGGLVVSDGGARMSFAPGDMPPLLIRLHKIDPRGLASEK